MEKKLLDLTAPQKSIWLTEQYYTNTNINNICATLVSNEQLDFEIFTKALNIVIQRSDNFKLHFVEDNEELKQYFDNIEDKKFEIIEIESKDDIKNLEQELLSNNLNIKEKLFEIKLFDVKNSTVCGCLINIHHIISDSYSLGLFSRDVMNTYSKLLNNEPIDSNNNFSYQKFIETENEYIISEKLKKDKEYWNEKFNSLPSIVTIPSTKPFSNDNIMNANRYKYTIDKSKLETFSNFCTQNRISIFNLFTTALAIYMNKINNTSDFVIGTPILNRTNFNEKNTLGMFVNVSPLLISIDGNPTIKDLIGNIVTDTLGLLRHQKYSYNYILEDLRKDYPSVPNLYNIVLSYQITKTTSDSNIDYSANWIFNGTCASDIEIQILDPNNNGALEICYDYKATKYDETDISNLNKRLIYVLDQVISNINANITDICIATPDEQDIILNKFNSSSVDLPDTNVIELYEKQVQIYPDKNAITYENNTLTYSELDKKVNQLANYLIEQKIKNKIVGVYLNKSTNYIISALALLKSGNILLPISSSYPKDRIQYMLKNTKAPLLITTDDLLNNVFSHIQTLDIEKFNFDNYDTKFDSKINVKSQAYVIFTSGSTGLPKAVGVSHLALLNHILGIQHRFENTITENDVALSIANISFDANIQEIFIPLSFGAHLHLLDDDSIYNPELLSDYIATNKITFAFIPPTLLDILYEKLCTYQDIKLNKLLVGVQSINNVSLNNYFNFNSNIKIHNGYGPTEATICCVSLMYNHKDEESQYILPIGKPMDNCEVYILDNSENLLPPNATGELCISGLCLSEGYIKLPEKTKEKFKFINSIQKFVYKTGDLAYYKEDGNLVFAGREDNQIKLHGFRIELDEINTIISKNKHIKSSYTVLYKENQIYSFVVFKNNTTYTIEELKEDLKNKLPYYMIPANIYLLEKMPSNKNGKVDFSELLSIIENKTYLEEKEYIPAETPTEKTIEKILEQLLNAQSINFNNNFFDIGGDSLSAIKVCSAIKNEFNIEITVKNIFESKNLRELSKFIDDNINTQNSIEKFLYSANTDFYPLSSAQKRIYYTSNMSDDKLGVYNISGGLEFSAHLDFEKIQKSFEILISRHESFRTFFEMNNGDITQKILKNIDFKLEKEYISNQDVDKCFKEFNTNFSLNKAPLLKAKILYLSNNHTMIFINMHHIISDGASMQILLNEFCKIYNDEELDKLKFTYRDYINYEKYFTGSDIFIKNKEFWMNEFADEIPTLNMPTNYPRPAAFSYNGSTFTTTIHKNLTERIVSLCKSQQVTPYIFFLSVYYILLYKYTGQNSIVVGSPMANRDIMEFSNIIGMFVNTIPIKQNIYSNQISFSTFLNEVKDKILNCLVHGNYPFDELVKNLNLPRDISRHPVFDTMFTYQNQGMKDITIGKIHTQYYTPDTNISKFDLSLEIIPKNDSYTLNIEYCTDLFTSDFIEELSNHYICLIKNILNNLNTKICDLDILSITERNKLLYEFNNTKIKYDKNDFIYKAIDRKSIEKPDYTAITFKDEHLTYKEFYEKTNSLANYMHKLGIGKNSYVGIMLPRSAELLVAIVATLKTGACYIPIDPAFPKNRIEYMLNNSNTALLLTLDDNLDIDRKQLNVSFNKQELYLDKELKFVPPTQSEDPAYLIYTSGSTGNPKGVVIPHRAVTNLALSMNNDVEYLREDYGNMAMASITTVSFDIFVFETLISLQKGLNVVVASEEEQVEPTKINELFTKNNVLAFQTTPSKMEIIVNNKALIPALYNVKYVTLVGEALTNNLKNRIVELGITLYNAYGPTETTVFSTYTDVTNYDIVTIGRPMANTQILLLDKDNNLCPIGVPGELCICGDGVGLGYKNISPNQKNNYTTSPISKRKMYRTGDLAKYLPNGELLYIGRIDNQIKLRGLRIELEEIENKILEFKNIKKTVIMLQKDNSDREYLVAYLTVKDKISINKLREHLRKYLPKYMIPSYFEILDEFPYTPNGKVDKKLLPLPQIQTKNQEYVGPRNEMDKKILEIFERLLNLSPIGIKDNFFELGGDSLLAINLQLEIMKVTNGISYADIFLNPTVQELTDKITNLNNIVESLSDTVTLLNCNTTIQSSVDSNFKPEKITVNNILLLGATGYLGIHILNEFLNTESGNIYCLLRAEKGLSLKNKLLNKLHFYFGEKYDDLIDKRIFIISGDISLPNLGLSEADYELVKNQITSIINCAAKVSHFGKYELYKKINVDGVNNLIDFCKKNNKTLYHTSTTSISGEKLNTNTEYLNVETTTFTENNFFINQYIDNVYVRSKFEAEKSIITELKNGLDAYIIRVGNLMGRYSDGHFQQNIEENAYINRIISFIRMKAIPEHFLEHTLEFTPIDYCSKAFLNIITHTHNTRIFHLIDSNVITIKNLIDIFAKNYYTIKPLENSEFKLFINSLIKNSNYNYLNGIISDFDNDGKLSYKKEIYVDASKTNMYLQTLDFEWPVIDETYITKFLNYLDTLYKF